MRVPLSEDPFGSLYSEKPWYETGIWPCQWIGLQNYPPTPFVLAYRCPFSIPAPTIIRIHVSADERYELFLDGRRIGRGPERGDPLNWFFETYDLPLAAGDHMLAARVWSFGTAAPAAQMTVHPGFLLAPQAPAVQRLLGTGVAEWEIKALDGYAFYSVSTEVSVFDATGPEITVDGARFCWGFECGAGNGWRKADVLASASSAAFRIEHRAEHLLKPAPLPAMAEALWRSGGARYAAETSPQALRHEPIRILDHNEALAAQWTSLFQKDIPIEIRAHSNQRIIVDLNDYGCAYPELVTSGGAGSMLSICWAESLFQNPATGIKGNRDEIEGKYFLGKKDCFLPDGGPSRRFETLWWRCGRYLEISVQTRGEPLRIESIQLHETRYPMEPEACFHASDSRFEKFNRIAVRTLQMCSHETYMDCPYYEQLMYVGDTRVEALTGYALTQDDRLQRKALGMFFQSRLPSGLTQSRYPSHIAQTIPPFSLWWIAMVHDFALWRGDKNFVRTLMPGVRAVIDYFQGCLNSDGLLEMRSGWAFFDWVPSWKAGVPPGGEGGINSVANWQFALVLRLAAELEDWLEETELATRCRRLGAKLVPGIMDAFWKNERGLFSDDPAGEHYSEHAQCLAVLSGWLDFEIREKIRLFSDEALARTTIYFSHYLFETCAEMNRMDILMKRLNLWLDLDRHGFKTTFESPVDYSDPSAPLESRSDCHAWGAHPLYHELASILGIRPAQFGFETVKIRPRLGPLRHVSGIVPHPRGDIHAEFAREGSGLAGRIILPPGLYGTCYIDDRIVELHPGSQEI